jgi:GNAT superfamily N-acetyltransferase
MTAFQVKPLDETTWPDFARLAAKHNGVWGGCWCLAFHARAAAGRIGTQALNRSEKERRVRAGEAHAALVYEGSAAVGWCQFGTPAELPRIKYRAAVEERPERPDWRITCFFVDRDHTRRGVAAAALAGALAEIARLGGGTVESYPEDVEGRKVSRSFLHNATVSLFERHGFKRDRRVGKNRWVMSTLVRRSQEPVADPR